MKKLIIAAITATVVIIVLAGCLMPVIDDAKDNEKTVFNNSYNRYSMLLDSDVSDFTMSVVWETTSTNATVTIGDEEPYTYSMSSTRTPLVCTEEGMFNANKANNRALLYYSGSSSTVTVTDSPITIEVANGVVTVTDSAETPNTYSWAANEWLFYPDSNGNYSAVNTTTDADSTIYLNSIDDLYFATVISTDSLGFVSGHGDTCKFYNVDDTPTYSMSLANSSLVDGFTDVISTTIGDYDISTDAGVNSDESAFTPFITMVPRSVDGHTTQNNAISNIYDVIPAMVIIALLASIVAIVVKTRNN